MRRFKKIDDYQAGYTQASILSRYYQTLRAKGIGYTLKKSFFKFLFPWVRPYLRASTFLFNSTRLQYSNHSYETGHSTERSVEIPIVNWFKQGFDGSRTLEIGNVFSHSVPSPGTWEIVDKYELQPGIINQDIISFMPGHKYDFIFSISTFEHIGFDEIEKDPDKIQIAINHVTQHLLSTGGFFLLTVPLGWNAHLDEDIRSNRLPFQQVDILKRRDWAGHWDQIPLSQAESTYGKWIGADYLAVLQFRKPEIVA